MRPDPIKRWQGSWCPSCKAPAGPDCPDSALDHRAAVKRARAQSRAFIRRFLKENR